MSTNDHHRVTCATCLREERWGPEGSEVLTTGGRRKPTEPSAIAAWRLLRAHIEGRGGPIVGACPGCGQPLVGEMGMTPAVWTVEVPGGPYQIGATVQGPEGAVDVVAAEAAILAAHKPPAQVGKTLFSGMLLTSMLFPLLLWALAFTTFFSFLYLLYSGGTTVPS